MFESDLPADVQRIETAVILLFNPFPIYVLIKVSLGARDYELYLLVFKQLVKVLGMDASRWT